MAVVQTFGVVIAAAWLNTWWSYLLAFLLMGRGHCLLNILGHEAAHRLLFPNRRANDLVGRWLLAYPTFLAFGAYRRVHFAHHRDELGPEEPDIALYRGYPIAADSWHRKLRRDLFGISAYKNFKGLYFSLRKRSVEAWQILAVQVVLLGASIAFMRPLAYVVWIVSWSTLWKFSNRLRAIAEHGGMERSSDRRRTTHVIRQTPIARYLHGAVQHRLAPRPPRRHGRAVAQPARSCTTSWSAPAGWCPTSSTRRTGRSGRPARPASRADGPRRRHSPSDADNRASDRGRRARDSGLGRAVRSAPIRAPSRCDVTRTVPTHAPRPSRSPDHPAPPVAGSPALVARRIPMPATPRRRGRVTPKGVRPAGVAPRSDR